MCVCECVCYRIMVTIIMWWHYGLFTFDIYYFTSLNSTELQTLLVFHFTSKITT